MENWKEDILKSMEGAKRASPPPELFSGIHAKIARNGRMTVVPRPYLALAAASLAFLIMANVWAVTRAGGSLKTESSTYQLSQANFDLYP